LNKTIETQKKELLEARAFDKKLKEPENIPRAFISRTYDIKKEGMVVRMVEPADILYNQEIGLLTQIHNIILPDPFYWLPSKDFMEQKLLPAYREHLRNGQIKYNIKYVCHNFSNDFCIFSQYVYTDLVINKQAQAIAVSEIYYFRQDILTAFIEEALKISPQPGPVPYKPREVTSNEQHAINMAILDDMSVMFIEPQTGKEVFLSVDERRSITFCKF
jgi:hypothetical protein